MPVLSTGHLPILLRAPGTTRPCTHLPSRNCSVSGVQSKAEQMQPVRKVGPNVIERYREGE